eukprot:CCRYP_007644-RA/>CCRYP_007644-RA protein AED:0.23 eAED:0.18 QI:0/0/0/0.33/1/1/3/0/748
MKLSTALSFIRAIITTTSLGIKPPSVHATPGGCFATTTALQAAVEAFDSEGCASNSNCATQLTWGPINDWCTSLINDMSYLFSNLTSFNEDISGWDTSSVTNMQGMFLSAEVFNQDISGWNTAAVQDMSYMFYYAFEFNQTLSGWDTSSVTNMEKMFYYAYYFNGDISGWDTGNVRKMNYMFYSCDGFNQDISSWNTGSVTTMKGMFYQAYSFNQDLSGWNTGRVTNMVDMFDSAYVFNGDISGWNTSSVTDMEYMFYSAEAFNRDLSGWDTSSVTNMYFMFSSAYAFNGDISGWNTLSVINMENVFYGASAFNRDISGWNTESVTTMAGMLCYASAFNQDISGWDTGSVNTMYDMFNGASVFNVDISGWDISSVTNMESMFYNAHTFNQDLCRWKDNFPYNSAFGIFVNSGCTNKGTPIDSSSTFCAAGSNCVVPSESPSKSPSMSPTQNPTKQLTSCPALNVRSIRITSSSEYIQMFEFRAYTDSGVEVAQDKTATQSSTYNNKLKFVASMAVDGDSSTFSHTERSGSIWEVDLGQDYNISYISIKNRYCGDTSDRPGCLCRLSNATVTLLGSLGNVVESASFNDTCGVFYPFLSFDSCSDSCGVKKVKLESTTQQFIQIFELQAISAGVNVALGGSATQSSLFNNDLRFVASKAIDGINATFSHTGSVNGWLEVDFAASFHIERIVILNRWCRNSNDPQGCLCRLSDSNLTLYGKNDSPVATRQIGNTCGLPIVWQEFMSCPSAP